jgi:hypothetical protein
LKLLSVQKVNKAFESARGEDLTFSVAEVFGLLGRTAPEKPRPYA